jgi:hypothetical protein
MVNNLLEDLIPGALTSCRPLFLVGLHCYTQDIEVLSATCQQKNAGVTIMITVRDAFKELWESFWRLEYPWGRLVAGGVAMLILVTFTAWQFMIPLWILVALTMAYLRYARGKDSLGIILSRAAGVLGKLCLTRWAGILFLQFGFFCINELPIRLLPYATQR